MTALVAAAASGACGTHGGLADDPRDGGPDGVSCTDAVFIPEGAFMMGVDEPVPSWAEYGPWQTGPLCYLDEKTQQGAVVEGVEEPVHEVYVSGFWIERFETTTRCYSECLEAGVCGESNDPYDIMPDDYYSSSDYAEVPITHTRRGDAERYCEYRGGRLPTEAEWEKAARGPEGWAPAADEIDCQQADVRRYSSDGGCAYLVPDEYKNFPLPVDARPGDESPYGVRGVLGGAWEWVRDWFDPQYFQTGGPPWVDPRGPAHAPCPEWRGMLRGGALGFGESPLTDRRATPGCDEDCWHYDAGIRCAWDSSPVPGW